MTSNLVSFGEDPDKEYYFCYEGMRTAHGGIDITGEWVHSHSYSYDIILHKYAVLKHTPKGVWLNTLGPTDHPNSLNARFVNRSHNKQFAWPTINEALESFIARKTREAGIYHARGLEAEKYKYLAMERWVENTGETKTAHFQFKQFGDPLRPLVVTFHPAPKRFPSVSK